MKHTNKLKLIALLTSCAGLAFADQNIEIVGGSSAGAPKLTIVNFTGDNGSVIDEITSDFKITGDFSVNNVVSSDAIDPTTQYVISGSVNNDPTTGQVQVTYQLTNNTTKEVLLNQTASFNSKFQRKAIHTIDNNIYQKLTNTPGIFNTKVALTAKQGSKYSLVLSDFDGYNPKTLLSTNRPITSLAWDKTGQNISYVTYETGKPVVYVQSLTQGSRYIVANFNGSNSSPAFSANGQKLAVTLSKDYGSHIYLVNNQRYNSASQAMPLINYGTIDTEADISANGKVIFTSDHDGGPQIFMSDLNGSAPTRVTTGLGNYNTTARYSNDGTKITFINRNNGVLQTYVLDLITKSAYPINMSANHDLAPSFAPNDKLVMYSSDNNVYISNTTGTVQTKLNNFKYGQIIDQRWSRSF